MHPEQLQDDLLVKYFLNWCTPEEEEKVTAWLELKDDNREYYHILCKSEKLSNIMLGTVKLDVNGKWEKFREEHVSIRNNIIPLYETGIKDLNEAPAENKPVVITLRRAITVAASILLVAALGSGLLLKKDKAIATKYLPDRSEILIQGFEMAADNNSDSIKIIRLPDQSLVHLSPDSRFGYKELSGEKTRQLVLTGKARFTIYKDASRPFTVFSGDIATTALGTEFTVDHVENEKLVVVRLYEGKVVIKSSPGITDTLKSDYFLSPMQELVYDQRHHTAAVKRFGSKPLSKMAAKKSGTTGLPDNPGTPHMGRDSWFMFNNQPLDQVFKQLMEMYETNIEYPETDLSKTYLIGTFNKSDSLEHILSQIARLNDLRLIKRDNKFIIRK